MHHCEFVSSNFSLLNLALFGQFFTAKMYLFVTKKKQNSVHSTGIIIIIETYIWDPLITKWFFSLQLKCKNENAKSVYLLFT